MSDFSMCLNTGCPSRLQCYRQQGPDNGIQQSYTKFIVPDGKDRCDYFLSAARSLGNVIRKDKFNEKKIIT